MMNIDEAYIYKDGSCFISELLPHGTLLVSDGFRRFSEVVWLHLSTSCFTFNVFYGKGVVQKGFVWIPHFNSNI